MSKIHTYYYVFLNEEKEEYFNGGITFKNEWIDNLEYCYFVKDLSRAREVKNKIKQCYGVECKIIKIELLEIE